MAAHFLLYIDPGSGSFLVQVILAGTVGILFYLRGILFKTRAFLSWTKKFAAGALHKGWLPPLLIGIFFILFRTKHVFILFSIPALLFYALLIAASGLIIYSLLVWLIKNQTKAAIITSLFMLLFLFYEPAYASVKNIFPRAGFPILILFLLAVFLLWRTGKNLLPLLAYVNAVFACLILLEGSFAFKNLAMHSADKKYIAENYAGKDRQSAPGLPNIYYIVFDSYTSSASLKKYFSYDNSEIEYFLQSKGFFVAKKAGNKFNSTDKSISSVLNMSYGKDLDSIFEDKTLSAAVYCRNIQYSEVMKKLALQNYKFINLSFFDIGETRNYYDMLFIPSANYTGQFLFMHSRLASFYVKEARASTTDLAILKQLGEIPREYGNERVFTYAHLSFTHKPYHFDRNGNFFEKGPFAGDEKKNYVESVMFANACIKKIIEKILSVKTPSVVILQGDHGSRFFQGTINDPEQYTILSAYYFPDRNYDSLHESVSPVNSYRVVFNKYFNCNYKLLP